MRLTLQNTSKIVELIVDGTSVPARIWEGHTEGGIPCHAYITRIAVHKDLDASEFELALLEQPALRPTPAIEAIPARLVL
jgi:hypothetical protein